MKIGEAQKIYRTNQNLILEQRSSLMAQKKELEKKIRIQGDSKGFSEEAATLELSIQKNQEIYEQNLNVLNMLAEKEMAVFNGEVAKQQADSMKEASVDMAKIMEVARRIAKGAHVPAKDEQKLMEFSMELYMSAKNLAIMNEQKKKEKYDSLWDDDEVQKQYDPEGTAQNAEVGFDLPDISIDIDSGEGNGSE